MWKIAVAGLVLSGFGYAGYHFTSEKYAFTSECAKVFTSNARVATHNSSGASHRVFCGCLYRASKSALSADDMRRLPYIFSEMSAERSLKDIVRSDRIHGFAYRGMSAVTLSMEQGRMDDVLPARCQRKALYAR